VYGRGYGSSGFGFGPAFTPPLIINLMIANAVVFVADLSLGHALSSIGAVNPRAVWQGGQLWQPFTYMWLHGNFLHLAFNMLTLWMFGSTLVMAWGPQRFLRFYLLCGVGAGLILAVFPYLLYPLGFHGGIYHHTLGASGAIYGVLLAYSLTWPDRVIALIFPPVAFRAIWMIPIFFVMNLMSGGNVSHLGHLGGVVVGWLYMRRHGGAGIQQLSWAQVKHRFQRWRMRRRLKAIQYQEWEERRRNQDRRFH
jgi:membrane associated rhomboid family serine protease